MAPSRQRSLAATVDWSYRLLDDQQQRVFRAVSVFPAGFTLDGAEAVAGQGAAPGVAHLVDCSLLTPPRAGADGRLRYSMLETLRGYGAARLAEAGEQQEAAALAGYALQVAGQAAAGLQTRTGEQDAARWLDAEDATTRQVLAWATGHDPQAALRLAGALGWWWFLRGRLPGQYPLLREVTGHGEPGSDPWCAAQYWAGWAAWLPGDLAGALDLFTALRGAVADRPPSRALAGALVGRSAALRELGQVPEAAEDARRALAVARELDYPLGKVLGLVALALAAAAVGDADEAVRSIRQAGQVPGDIPASIARNTSSVLAMALFHADDLAAAESVCAAGLAASRDTGDLLNQPFLLGQIAGLELRTGRTEDAAAHLREALQIELRAGVWNPVYLDACGFLCAATGRYADAVTSWATYAALSQSVNRPWYLRPRQELLRASRQALGPDEARAAEDRGAAMSQATAAEYVLMLTGSGPQQPQASGPELGQLSFRERELVTLVGQGRTDAQIAAQLDISIRMVRSHLDHIRDKTGCRRRADLTA